MSSSIEGSFFSLEMIVVSILALATLWGLRYTRPSLIVLRLAAAIMLSVPMFAYISLAESSDPADQELAGGIAGVAFLFISAGLCLLFAAPRLVRARQRTLERRRAEAEAEEARRQG